MIATADGGMRVPRLRLAEVLPVRALPVPAPVSWRLAESIRLRRVLQWRRNRVRGQGRYRKRALQNPFNVPQQRYLIGRDQRDGASRTAGARGASNTVNVVFWHVW